LGWRREMAKTYFPRAGGAEGDGVRPRRHRRPLYSLLVSYSR
jgi:hypothetical protein